MRHLRIILLTAFLLACLALPHIPAVRGTLGDPAALRQKLTQYGWAAGPVSAGLVAALVVVGVPRLALCSAAGLVFGFLGGLLWAQIGTIIGSYATFCFVRWAGRELILRKWGFLNRYADSLGRAGWATVLLARFMPINGLFVDTTLALTAVKHRDFLWASALGFLPEAIPATLIGAGVGQKSLVHSVEYVLIAAACLAIAGFFLAGYRRRSALVKHLNGPTSGNRAACS